MTENTATTTECPTGEMTPHTSGTSDLGADSPFLPGTFIQFAWDSTSLGYIKRCPRLYYYQMILGWQPRDESVHLRFGIEYHHAFHMFEQRKQEGMAYEDNLHQMVKEVLLSTADWDPDHQYKNRKNLIRTIVWYAEKFRHDPAVTHIMETGRVACEVSFKFQLDWGPKQTTQSYLLCGHLDRVVHFQNEMYVMDRKTTKYTPEGYYFDGYNPENQMSLYTLAGQVLFQTAIRGVIIDAAQVVVGFSRFERGFTYRTTDQIDEWVNDLHYWFALAEEYAKANYWPMNDMACSMYGGCKFRNICSKSPKVREKFLAADFVKVEPWNPLKER